MAATAGATIAGVPALVRFRGSPEAAAERGTVLYYHGGPHNAVALGWNEQLQVLAGAGFAVVAVNFRGSTGFGLAHFRAGWKQWGQAMQDDLADAVAWAVQRRLVDPKRVCLG